MENVGVSKVAQRKMILLSMRTHVQSLALFSRLRIRHCHELWYRSQMWLRSGIAVAVALASGYSSISTISLVSIPVASKKWKYVKVTTLFPGNFPLGPLLGAYLQLGRS